jgi:hypothetical protein
MAEQIRKETCIDWLSIPPQQVMCHACKRRGAQPGSDVGYRVLSREDLE